MNNVYKILLLILGIGLLAAGYRATTSQAPTGINNDMSVERWLMTAHDVQELARKNNKVIEGVIIIISPGVP